MSSNSGLSGLGHKVLDVVAGPDNLWTREKLIAYSSMAETAASVMLVASTVIVLVGIVFECALVALSALPFIYLAYESFVIGQNLEEMSSSALSRSKAVFQFAFLGKLPLDLITNGAPVSHQIIELLSSIPLE